MSTAVPIANISNPIPILQQESSKITTNTLIPKISSIEVNPPVKPQTNSTILAFQNINQKISSSLIGIFNDLFIKPNDISWINYLQTISKKDQRYFYIGIFLIMISIVILLIKQLNN